MVYMTFSTEIMTVVQNRPPAPSDGLCVDCKKNEHKYIKKHKYVCRYCWDRDEYPELISLTDAELDQRREKVLAYVKTQKIRDQMINVPKLGF